VRVPGLCGRGGVRGVVVHPSPKPFAPAARALAQCPLSLSVLSARLSHRHTQSPAAAYPCPHSLYHSPTQILSLASFASSLPRRGKCVARSFLGTGTARRVPQDWIPTVPRPIGLCPQRSLCVCVFVAIRFLISQPHHLSIEHVPNTHHPRSKASFTLLRHLPCSATLQEPASLVSTHLRTAAPAFQPATPTTRACKPTLSKAALPPKSNAPRPVSWPPQYTS
jgi:hypothetical protein